MRRMWPGKATSSSSGDRNLRRVSRSIVLQQQNALAEFSATPDFDLLPQLLQFIGIICPVDGLSCSRKSSMTKPFWSQNTDSITLPVDGRVLNFFVVGESACFHCIEACFVSGSKWCTPVSSKVMIL